MTRKEIKRKERRRFKLLNTYSRREALFLSWVLKWLKKILFELLIINKLLVLN